MNYRYEVIYKLNDKSYVTSTYNDKLSDCIPVIINKENKGRKIVGIQKIAKEVSYIDIKDVIYVANIRLIDGGINKCCIFDEDGVGIELKEYLADPMSLLVGRRCLKAQNTLSSIFINAEDVASINIEIMDINDWR
nr:MAG TPA: hypothetical protein [Caudoviricetes sp.]